MKKILLSAIILLSSFQLVTAQNPMEDMVKEMEVLQKEMLKQMEQLNLNGDGFQFFLDTIITQNFGDLDIDINENYLNQLDPALFDDMFKEMQKQLSQIDEDDWAQLEQMLKGLEGILPMGPVTPNDRNTPKGATPEKDKPAKKGEKKRKTYKM